MTSSICAYFIRPDFYLDIINYICLQTKGSNLFTTDYSLEPSTYLKENFEQDVKNRPLF